jgi:hypothetical protein
MRLELVSRMEYVEFLVRLNTLYGDNVAVKFHHRNDSYVETTLVNSDSMALLIRISAVDRLDVITYLIDKDFNRHKQYVETGQDAVVEAYDQKQWVENKFEDLVTPAPTAPKNLVGKTGPGFGPDVFCVFKQNSQQCDSVAHRYVGHYPYCYTHADQMDAW